MGPTLGDQHKAAQEIRQMTAEVKLRTILKRLRVLIIKLAIKEAMEEGAHHAAGRRAAEARLAQIRYYMRYGALAYKAHFGRDWPGADNL